MSIFSLFKRKSFICPYCLTEHYFGKKKVDLCPKCKSELPVGYLNNYEQVTPFFIQLIGWSAAGKTTYLQSLTLILKKMERFWDGYICTALTETTLQFMRNVKSYEADGALPIATQLQLQDAYIMALNGMQRWGKRTLVVRDVAGEHFNSLQFPLEFMPYLLHAPVSIMMISLADERNRKNFSIDELLHSYVSTLERHKKSANTSKSKVIVALSKADKLLTELPNDLQRYLQDDPFNINNRFEEYVDLAFMSDYMENLYRTSEYIKDWFVEKVPGGQMFINIAKNENIELFFTLVSSTGVEPGEDLTISNINPLRVMDPCFIALDVYSKNSYFFDQQMNKDLTEAGLRLGTPGVHKTRYKQKIKVFLCHASQDKPAVQELYQKLVTEGWIEPWLDEKNLLPGQDWQAEIRSAVETSDAVVIFLSNTSVNKDGFIQKELRLAREVAMEKTDGSIFLIPLRLDNCEVPKGLQLIHWANYFGDEKENTYYKLTDALKFRLENSKSKSFS
jgi:hypothetical protein